MIGSTAARESFSTRPGELFGTRLGVVRTSRPSLSPSLSLSRPGAQGDSARLRLGPPRESGAPRARIRRRPPRVARPSRASRCSALQRLRSRRTRPPPARRRPHRPAQPGRARLRMPANRVMARAVGFNGLGCRVGTPCSGNRGFSRRHRALSQRLEGPNRRLPGHRRDTPDLIEGRPRFYAVIAGTSDTAYMLSWTGDSGFNSPARSGCCIVRHALVSSADCSRNTRSMATARCGR